MNIELALSNSQLSQLLRDISPGKDIHGREVLWDWQLSRVERAFLVDGSSIILKRSKSPLIDEGRILQSLRDTDIPLADLYLAHAEDDTLTLLMEDLGPSKRQPTLKEGAAFAVRAQAAPPPENIRVMDEQALQGLPLKILEGIESLASSGRWRRVDRLLGLLDRINAFAPDLSQGATTPPFGLCHSEFHPTSLHVGTVKTALVDWARAFVGPGLLDLASWFDIVNPPDRTACRSLIDAYVAAGGAPETSARRGSLPAENWAFFWHRLGAVEWWVASCTSWMNDHTQDPAWQQAVEGRLKDAHSFLP